MTPSSPAANKCALEFRSFIGFGGKTLSGADPGDGGRRSRRGFAYQDAVTLLDCLDMHDGAYDEVAFEALEDITCRRLQQMLHRQVKTSESGNRHSIATVCKPDIKTKVETSILGKLFLSKPLDDEVEFCLVVNETPAKDLVQFVAERGSTRGPIDKPVMQDLATRLAPLPINSGRSIDWYLDRFFVLVEARTTEQVEDAILRRLRGPVAALLGQQPLMSELEEVLLHFSTKIARDAASKTIFSWTAQQFSTELQTAVTKATGRRADGSTDPLETLVSKLSAAGVPPDEAVAYRAQLLQYRRRYRSAVGEGRASLDSLNDHVFAICAEVAATRRAGHLQAGASTYHEVLRRVAALSPSSASNISIIDKIAALSDVTARCQNRYVDNA